MFSQTPDRPVVTYYQDVEPIIQAKCLPCHHPGGVGPFELSSFELVRKHSGLVRFQSMSKAMPPIWATSDHGEIGAVTPLSDEEIVVIQRWMQGGMQEGKEPDSSVRHLDQSNHWNISNHDTEIKIFDTADRTKAEGVPYWRVQAAQVPLKQSKLQAFSVTPAEAKVVRSVTLGWVMPGDPIAKMSSTESFGSMNLPGNQLIGLWAPGYKAWELPPDTYLQIPEGAVLVAQVLYRPTGKAEPAGISVKLRFAPQATKKAQWLTADYGSFVIPAGQSPLMKVELELKGSTELLAILPEARFYATRFRVLNEISPDQKTTLFDNMRWDPYWMGNYTFSAPIRMSGRSKLIGEVGYSNDDRCPMNEDRTPEPVLSGSGVRQEVFRLHALVVNFTE